MNRSLPAELPPESRWRLPIPAAGSPSAATLAQVRALGGLFEGAIQDLLWLPDGRLALAGAFGLRILDPETLNSVDVPSPGPLMKLGHGPMGLLGMARVHGQLELWLLGDSPRRLLETGLHEDARFACEPSGRIVATGQGFSLLVLDPGAEQPRVLAQAPTSQSTGLRPTARGFGLILISPDGRTCFATDKYISEGAWDLETGTLLWSRTERLSRVYAFSPSNTLLEAQAFQLVELDPRDRSVKNQVMGRDHEPSHLVLGGGAVWAIYDGWENETPVSRLQRLSPGLQQEGEVHRIFCHAVRRLAVSETTLAWVDGPQGTLNLRTLPVGQDRSVGGYLGHVDHLSAGAGAALVQGGHRHPAILYSGDSYREVALPGVVLEGPATLHPSGTLLAVADGSLKNKELLRVMREGETLWERPGRAYVRQLAFRPGSEQLVVRSDFPAPSRDGEIVLYQPEKTRAALRLSGRSPRELSFSADGSTLAVAWEDAVVLIELRTGSERLRRASIRCSALALSRDGSVLVYGGGGDSTLTRVQGEQSSEISLPYGVGSLCFSPDDSLLFVGLLDGRLLALDPVNGSILTELGQHNGPLMQLMIADGLLWSQGGDGTVRAWGVPGGTRPSAEPAAPAPGLPEPEPEPAPPAQDHWPLARAQLSAEVLSYGARRFTMGWSPQGNLAPFDEAGVALRGLPPARKTDDARLVDQAKARYAREKDRVEDLRKEQLRLLKEAFILGRRWTWGELRAAAAHPALGGMLRGLWWRHEAPLRWVDTGLQDLQGQPVNLPDSAPLRLLHPASLSAELLSACKAAQQALGKEAVLEQLDRKVRRASGWECAPIWTDWAKTQNDLISAILLRAGWLRREEEGGVGDLVFHRIFPDFGGVAVLEVDGEHGIPHLRFHRLVGREELGEAVQAQDLDPQVASEALLSSRAAYPHDPDTL